MGDDRRMSESGVIEKKGVKTSDWREENREEWRKDNRE